MVDFDGSTDIGDCLSALCVRCALRPALLSGYALYAEDALEQGRYVLLKGKQKVSFMQKIFEPMFITNGFSVPKAMD